MTSTVSTFHERPLDKSKGERLGPASPTFQKAAPKFSSFHRMFDPAVIITVYNAKTKTYNSCHSMYTKHLNSPTKRNITHHLPNPSADGRDFIISYHILLNHGIMQAMNQTAESVHP